MGMRHSLRPLPLSVALLASSLVAQPEIHPDEIKLKPRIDKAIADGVEHILDQQFRDGSWSHSGYPGGQTGLCVYALLKSGVQPDHPGLRRAFAFLDTIEPQKTYATACMMLAYAATGEKKYRPRLRSLLARMIEWQSRNGTWGYPHGATDLSNTQYAALALWTANKEGLPVPSKVWMKLVEGTLLYQEDRHDVDVKVGKKTGVTKRSVAGFEYRPRGRKPGPGKATGTMTTAGVSILKICEIGLGKRLRKRDRRKITDALDAGLSWLDVHFSVRHPQRPGGRGGWLHYYLYGMERVGALTRKEQFGEHYWYLEGAKLLLQQQKKGAWGRAIHDTCFALLFLRRATRIVGPTTGGASVKSTHLFAAGSVKDDIQFRGAGQKPLMLYINGFGKGLLDKHSAYGLRVLRVEYLLGDRKIGELAGDPMKAWKTDTFVHRCTSLTHGAHKIVAKVIALAPDAPNGETANTVVIQSKPMNVRIRDVIESWMEGIAKIQADNVLRDAKPKPKITVSTNPKGAKNLIDGLDATHWRADAKDGTPTITFEFKNPVLARRLILTQALKSRADLNRFGTIRAVEFGWDRSRKTERFEMNSNPMAPTVFTFRKVRKIRSFTLRIVERDGKKNAPLGFAEVILGAKRIKKKSRR